MGYKTVKNANGGKMLTWQETTENTYWRELWCNAWEMMPRHSATMLCKLLGYSVRRPGSKYNGANSRIYVNFIRGSKPKLPQQQRVLQMLGGPNGKTLLRAIAINRNLELK